MKYSLPRNTYVTLKVYDVIGKEVGVLTDGYETAGEHSINYDASRLPSGIYFYTLKTDGFTDTKKMTLLK
jgi:hypothetical protein